MIPTPLKSMCGAIIGCWAEKMCFFWKKQCSHISKEIPSRYRPSVLVCQISGGCTATWCYIKCFFFGGGNKQNGYPPTKYGRLENHHFWQEMHLHSCFFFPLLRCKNPGGGSKGFSIFTPTSGDDPIWQETFFKWIGEKPPTRNCLVNMVGSIHFTRNWNGNSSGIGLV